MEGSSYPSQELLFREERHPFSHPPPAGYPIWASVRRGWRWGQPLQRHHPPPLPPSPPPGHTGHSTPSPQHST
ncbi:hypothetical protein E2C01_081616 [Portunus trituberculatus]|uniref:Uncharacterized protein n=1 Tax=Portunus trituberculatus TaxID=210409 RepID=A0A5B7IMQ4_PORTR|nr:hypothetical protein [Portunus trituberculatus]